jgi:hypothetical protein
MLLGGDRLTEIFEIGVSFEPSSSILRLRGTYTSPISGRDNLLDEPPVTPDKVRSLSAESGN